MPPLRHPDEYELLDRSSEDSRDSFDIDGADFESYGPGRSPSFLRSRTTRLGRFLAFFTSVARRRTGEAAWKRRKQPIRPRRRISPRQCCFIFNSFLGIILAVILLTAIIRPSYTRLPNHYKALRQAVRSSSESGRGNPRNEKIFIAASLYDRDGSLAGGQWGENVLQLVDMLGENNVFLSIYENDSGKQGESALLEFERRVKCSKKIVYEPHLDVEDISHITLPNGTNRTKRIAYLAEVRNRALRPLDEPGDVKFDKLLYLNDVVFDPIDALQLLFSTHIGDNGVAKYRAACAVDFINPFKFYDTFATRDLEGYSMGVPFYPWFSTAGNAESRNDVLQQKDAVRVRSCWGGMVAFDAEFFQKTKAANTENLGDRRRADANSPARFRAEEDHYWDASECCLIHADIQLPPHKSEEPIDTGVYMNPFVRVAYDTRTLSWLGATRRFERLYSTIHNIINHIGRVPKFNPRRTEIAGEEVEDVVWVQGKNPGEGSYQTVKRRAGTGGFCGRRNLQVMVPNPTSGQKNWETLPVPSV
ncbi:hypothetical protein AJ80_01481 [Polytolypa hystricis UAMH7299]|uniref:Glycosyltransferase family 69 protein n=1 Tax=Polytolypa hystricis (strain UAMH7299) TaxID=1447883 RepID=A0A2B7Z196_POLH7|nr:hypothetical protein AJ80_01481 [Polytolypa hystricis UAMH7299]